MTARELIVAAYAAFNARDIDAALALMSENVSWPKASEGGRVAGKQEIRAYWTRQWAEFDPHVEVLAIVDGDADTLDAEVRQVVRNLHGDVLSDTVVRHVYTIANGLIDRMDAVDAQGGSDVRSSAFSES